MRVVAIALLTAFVWSAAAIAAFDVKEVDVDRDGKPDVVAVETTWYRIEFALAETGSARSMIYKPHHHELRAEDYYSNRNNMFRDWVRLAAPDPVSGLTRRIGNAELQTATRLPATYRIVHRTEEELALEFEVRYPKSEDAPWLEKIVNRRRIILRNDTPAVRVENTIANTDEAEHPVLFDLYNSVGLGRVETACYIPTPDGKLIGRDLAEERGSRAIFAPDVAGAWIGGVNEEGLGAAFSLEWPDVDSMEISLWKTVGSSYVVNMRRRTVPAGGTVAFRYTFMPFTGFGTLDGMADDLAGGVLVGAGANLFEDVSRAQVKPGATLPVQAFLASGTAREVTVHLRCERREDASVVLDEKRTVSLKVAETATLAAELPLGEAGLYVLTVAAEGGEGPLLRMEKGIEVGRTRLVYAATPPEGEKRGERDAGESIGPPTFDPQFRTIDRAHVTPHLPLIKGHANGPVKALFLTPADSTLGHVRELAQRADLDYEYIAVGKVQTPPDELNFRDLRDFRQRFRAGEQDVLVTLAVDWSVGLKRQLIRDILSRVEEGMGVVLFVRDLAKQPELVEALEQAEEMQGAPLPSAAVAVPQVRRWRLGEGRVVVVLCNWSNYRDGGEAALGKWAAIRAGGRDHDISEQRWRGFEYSYAWLDDLIRWAARKDSAVTIAGASLEGDTVDIALANAGPATAGRLSVVARSRRWEVRAQGAADVQVSPGASNPRVSLNTPPDAGPLALEFHLRDAEGKVVAFASAGAIAETGATLRIQPSPAYRRVGEAQPIVVEAAGAPEGSRLEVSVSDRFGRRVWQREEPVPATGPPRMEADLSGVRPLTVYHEAVARLHAGERLLAEAAADVFLLPLKPDTADRFVLGIADAPERRALHVQGILPATRSAGFTLHTHSYHDPTLYATGGTAAAMIMVTPKSRFARPGEAVRLDSANLIMHPPLLPSPEALAAFKESWQPQARDRFGRGAFFIGIDDERRMSGDFDFHPQTLAAFREWIAGRYPDIAALNATWGTDFKDFGEVMPKTRAQLDGSDNLSPWLEFRMFIGRVIGEYYMKAPAEWAAEISPDLTVGELGIYEPGPEWPVDWRTYGRYYRTTGRYSNTIGKLLLSFGEGARHGQWQGYGMTRVAPGRRAQAWTSLLDGGSFAWFWAMVDNGYWNYGLCTSDQRVTEGYAVLAAEEFPDLTGGIDRLILASRFTHDGIAIGYSYPSWLADPSALAAASRQIVEELGLQHRFVAMEDVAHGRLEKEGYRILILQRAGCLSPEEVEGMRRFAEHGGTVLVAGRSGFRDLHGAPIRGPLPLDGLLGLDTTGAEPLGRALVCSLGETRLRLHVDATGVRAAGTEVLGAAEFDGGTLPVLTRRTVGRGSVWWLNSTLEGHSATFTGGVAGEQMVTLEGPAAVRLAHWQVFREILFLGARVQPRAVVLDQGKPLFDTQTWYYESPSGRSLFLAHYLNREVPGALEVRLARKGHIYDLRAHRHLDEGDRFQAEFPRGRVNVFALLDYRIAGIDASVEPTTARPGETVTVTCTVRSEPAEPGPDLHAIRLRVLDPDGRDLECYRAVLPAENGRAAHGLPLALNAAAGTYTVHAFDVASGLEAQVAFTVQGEPR